MSTEKKDLQLFTMEFYIAREKTFSVVVKGWNDRGFKDSDYNNPVEKFHWNVYASIFEGHPLFGDAKKAIDSLPFSGGCTYDQMIESSPSQGIEYDWQKTNKTLKLGSDYSHSWDDYDNHQSPLAGIPYNVKHDAEELKEALINALEQQK